MKNNIFPLWLSPVLMGAGTLLIGASNMTIAYTPPDASLNTLLTGELVVPAQVPLPGAGLMKGLGLGAIGLGVAQLGMYAFSAKPQSPPKSDGHRVEKPFPTRPTSAVKKARKAASSKLETPKAPSEAPTQQQLPTSSLLPLNIVSELVEAMASPSASKLEPPKAPSEAPTQQQPPTSPLLPLGIVSELVEAIASPSVPQHAAIAAIPRAGKSYTLRGVIWGIKQVFPDACIRIVDPKNSPAGWLGLEKIPGCVRLAHQSLQPAIEMMDEAIALLDGAIETQDTTQNAYFIFDDWSWILAEAQRLDAKMSASDPNWSGIYHDLLYKAGQVAAKGLQYGIHLILVTHSWDCEAFGFAPQLRHAFAIAALGRKGRYEMLLSLLKSETLLSDDGLRDKLIRQTQQALEQAQNLESPILVMAGDRGKAGVVPDLEWLDWVDLSAFVEDPSESKLEADGATDATSQPNSPAIANPTAIAVRENPDQQQWERLLLESTDDQIDRLIERQRGKSGNLASGYSSRSIAIDGEYTLRRETFLAQAPKTPESALFEQIQDAVAHGETSASRLIESVLKGSSTQKYRQVGQSGFKYLIRKYGSTDLRERFHSELDQ